ncbi:MAG: class 1 fructose-bisphosphatase [Octadecabacter sp.]|nr:class 1 fructose-bisphosphatase [Octadecabacter sp.]
MTNTSKTYVQYLWDRRRSNGIDRDLVALLHSVATACKAVSNSLKSGALADILGSLETENVQGETQKKLDVIANDIFLRRCEYSGVLAAMVSEELEEVYAIPDEFPRGPYVLLFDPLDGSSNIDVNVSVGSIFSVYKLDELPTEMTYDAILRSGAEQVAAGYALYGPATMLVLSTGKGVDGFTLDASIGEFRHTHANIQVPPEAAEFAINMSRRRFWDDGIATYIDECISGETGPRKRDYNMRWVASMVAEVHRIMLRGGVFLYPVDSRNRADGGKLRLLYEANPMAMLIEQAGGAAITETGRILDVVPVSPHQRVGVMLGSKNEVEYLAAKLPENSA